MVRFILLFATLAACILACQPRVDPISYSKDIKPILNKKCLRCHGGIKQQGGFSLLFQEEAFLPTESGNVAIVPGNSNKSHLIDRIKSDDPDLRMPQEGTPCTQAEIDLLERWIDEGAKWDDHWSYADYAGSEFDTPLSEWAISPLDRFVEARLYEVGLTPNPAAVPSKLARRVSLDITGLPPKARQVEDYLTQPTLEKYEAMVDQMLASPHYGERMASMWLDLARYADSKGYEKDAHRSIWRYRDWLIQAFNDDMPFDQFTMEQLAGDLLEHPSTDQLIATAFHRNTMTNDEGGTEDEEYRAAAVVDRVNTTFEVWQGTTISCVQCHAHPYDPIRHEDYYRIYALFNNTQDADIGNEFPYLLEPRDSIHEKRLQDVAKWLSQQTGLANEGAIYSKRESLKQLVFPRLYGDFADDFQSVLIHSDGAFRNSSMNANNQKHKAYYLLYKGIPGQGLAKINFLYEAKGDDVLVRVYRDSVGGPMVLEADLSATRGNNEQWASFMAESFDGVHDLVFHLINTTGDFANGVAFFREIELEYLGGRLDRSIREQQDSLLKIFRAGIKTPIMRAKSAQLERETFVHERGNYLVHGQRVAEGVPKIFNPSGHSIQNRLELARWLVSDENRLTSRVIVNRIWEQIFGRGIVETLEDFGSQGMPPTHPQLLDYLAANFSGAWNWSIKKLLKEILMSSTYQQGTEVSDLKREIDPFNKLYSRGSRIRLSAEQIRDQALAVSGLLSRKIGGPSVMPPQPENVWQVVYNSSKWTEAEGEDRYRRGLYTYWKRTTPYPSMVAFDSPSREFCVSRRIRTNTPLQALVTLNDTVYLEAAMALAEKMVDEGKGDIQQAIQFGYKQALLVEPDSETVDILHHLYESARTPQARKVAKSDDQLEFSQADLEPLLVVANAILNLDAFLTKS